MQKLTKNGAVITVTQGAAPMFTKMGWRLIPPTPPAAAPTAPTAPTAPVAPTAPKNKGGRPKGYSPKTKKVN